MKPGWPPPAGLGLVRRGSTAPWNGFVNDSDDRLATRWVSTPEHVRALFLHNVWIVPAVPQ